MRISIDQRVLERLMNYVIEKSIPRISYGELSGILKEVQESIRQIEESAEKG